MIGEVIISVVVSPSLDATDCGCAARLGRVNLVESHHGRLIRSRLGEFCFGEITFDLIELVNSGSNSITVYVVLLTDPEWIGHFGSSLGQLRCFDCIGPLG